MILSSRASKWFLKEWFKLYSYYINVLVLLQHPAIIFQGESIYTPNTNECHLTIGHLISKEIASSDHWFSVAFDVSFREGTWLGSWLEKVEKIPQTCQTCGLMLIDYGKICKKSPTKQTKDKHTGENRHPSSSFYITSCTSPKLTVRPWKWGNETRSFYLCHPFSGVYKRVKPSENLYLPWFFHTKTSETAVWRLPTWIFREHSVVQGLRKGWNLAEKKTSSTRQHAKRPGVEILFFRKQKKWGDLHGSSKDANQKIPGHLLGGVPFFFRRWMTYLECRFVFVQGSIEKKTNTETHKVGEETQLEVCTLPETNSSPLNMDGWNTIASCSGPASSRVRTVSFRECTSSHQWLPSTVYIFVFLSLFGGIPSFTPKRGVTTWKDCWWFRNLNPTPVDVGS